jgi:hypothetical protein
MLNGVLMLVLMQDVGILVGSQKERCEVKVALSNSFGFGGHNSSILFAPFKWTWPTNCHLPHRPNGFIYLDLHIEDKWTLQLPRCHRYYREVQTERIWANKTSAPLHVSSISRSCRYVVTIKRIYRTWASVFAFTIPAHCQYYFLDLE